MKSSVGEERGRKEGRKEGRKKERKEGRKKEGRAKVCHFMCFNNSISYRGMIY
jgi:hypothetical protein